MRRYIVPLLLSLATAATAADQTADNNQQAANSGRLRTQLVAGNDVELSSQIAARIKSLPLKAGDAFRRGEVLVAFDCDLYRAQLRKAEASAAGADKQLQVTQRLAKLHSVGELDVEQADAKARETAADAAYMRTTVQSCSIRAPFDGRVAKRDAAPYEYVTPGKPLLEILDTGHLEVQLIAPSQWLRWVKPGTPFTVHIDDLDLDVPAEIVRIGASVDPVSQTVTLNGRVKTDNPHLLPGMSGWARFPGQANDRP